ncbi:MAG TPA: hypothetical protein DEO88_12370 [Syntrophobacteraceae bacterium]|nr:hypothetical protein [Syntrophobacteraceae bacterium]
MSRNPGHTAASVGLSTNSWTGPPIAVFWDQSLVWGLICLETLGQLQVPFQVVGSAEIRQGVLEAHRILLVPGGWAAHKMEVLGNDGQERIRQFVMGGGCYLGFCGGAGLALSSPPSLGLVPLQRLPLKERLPSASGSLVIARSSDHPIWQDLPEQLTSSVWWPSQFQWKALPSAQILASYVALTKDFWISDLPFHDLNTQDMDYANWEEVYGINLDPSRLLNQPAIIEARLGEGRVILSYPHLETPGDTEANRLLLNIMRYLNCIGAQHGPSRTVTPSVHQEEKPLPGTQTLEYLQQAAATAEDLIAFGQRHLLWNWRHPWLLHWRRGIRGLECGTLAVLLGFLLREMERLHVHGSDASNDPWLEPARGLLDDTRCFCQGAQRLLLEEKLASHNGTCVKLGKVNTMVDQLRLRLYGTRMNHGGLCRDLFDRLDRMLYQLLTYPRELGNHGERGTTGVP